MAVHKVGQVFFGQVVRGVRKQRKDHSTIKDLLSKID
jgi:hypothetical protein